jgi:protein TonB
MNQPHHEERRHTIIAFLITGMLYLATGGIIWYLQHQIAVSDVDQKAQKINLCLSSFVPESLPPLKVQKSVKAPAEQEPVPQEESQPPQKIESRVSDPAPKPPETLLKEKEITPLKPIVPKAVMPQKTKREKQKPKKKIIKRNIQKNTKKKDKKSVTKKSPKRKMHRTVYRKAAAAERKRHAAKQQHFSTAKKNAFLAMVRRRIDSHKHYPRIAKKRGMQGSVNVRFTILPNGSVTVISATGSKLFVRSAKEAVKAAFPLSSKHIPMPLPATVNLTLRYRLR